MTPERKEKFRRVAARRQPNLTVVLENIHDHHNIGAVLRSADSVGLVEIFVLNNEIGLARKNLRLGKRTSAGARRWVDVHYYTDTETCFQHLRRRYETILGAQLTESARPLYDIDLTGSVALVFGNERDGLSRAVLKHCDGNFIIPQMGMVESLNISVACAVTLYEAFRQRRERGFYDQRPLLPPEGREALFAEYLRRHESNYKGTSTPPPHRDMDLI